MKQSIIDEIKDQALQEIVFARTFKQGKITNWKKNEDMYYARAIKALESRSSVQLNRGQEFVHSILAKIDDPMTFKFTKRKNAQTRRVDLLNALREVDQKEDHWDIKDLCGKKQVVIYGRAIFNYYADSIDGRYKPHLDNVDCHNFLIDPNVNGIDIETARNMGDYSVFLNKSELKKGIKSGLFIKAAAQRLIDGNGNAGELTPELVNQRQRTYDQNTIGLKENYIGKDDYRLWRWFTTYDGDRYYLLMTPSGEVIRCELLEDILPVSEDFPVAAWPYWTYAAVPDLTEFWTPSPLDYMRENFMAQDVTINQGLDNTEAINKPQKVVNVTAIEDMASLKYRRDGIIKVKGDIDVNKAIQFVTTPSIETPLKMFAQLVEISDRASGVTPDTQGTADVNGQVGIYEGNQEATADRFGLLNKTYSFAYERFGRLWQMGVQDNLVKKVAVELIGDDGIELAEVKRSDIYKKGDVYGVLVEASAAQTQASERKREAKAAFLSDQEKLQNPIVNQKKSFEKQAEIAGFSQDEIKQLLDTSVTGDTYLLSKCDEDIEALLNGEKVRPNTAANTAYKQRMVDYLQDHSRDMTTAQFASISKYIPTLDKIISYNMKRSLDLLKQQRLMAMATAPPQPPQPNQQPPQPDPNTPPQPQPVGASAPAPGELGAQT